MATVKQSIARIPSLDGLRAISICLVLIGHASGSVNLNFPPFTHKLSNIGPFGVKVFFAISGYLITKLLLAEESSRGRISIGDFYLRRAFRIWPVAYAFIFLVAVLNVLGVLTLPPHNLLYAITFTTNHAGEAGIWWTGHLWSLAIEEQFYLVWPFVFLFYGTRGRVLTCTLAILLAPVMQISSSLYAPSVYAFMGASLLFLGGGIATGCLLALLEPGLLKNPNVVAATRSRWFLLVPIGALSANALSYILPGIGSFAVLDTVSDLLIGAAMWRFVHVDDWQRRILNTSHLVIVGRMSYSLYIWQQLFLFRGSSAWIHRFPQDILGAIAAALISYHGIEIPFLRLRNRVLHRLRTPGRQITRLGSGDQRDIQVGVHSSSDA